MKKCTKCKSKKIIEVAGKIFCHTCSDLKQILLQNEKNSQKNAYNKTLEVEQKVNTDKAYLRFRVFIVGDINGR